jgi:glyoxylase-like metal-dependent hydrolase (beta-lactamase superfamily II)
MAPIESLNDTSDVWVTEVELAEFRVRGVLVKGTARWLVWDTLSHPRDMAGFRDAIGRDDVIIAYSHGDWDHVWGTAGLPFERARIVAHELCAARFGEDVPRELDARRHVEAGTWDDVRLIPPTETFADDRQLDLGAVTVTLHHVPGHTRDATVAFLVEAGVLLTGDTAETPLPVVPSRDVLPGWIAGLERWAVDDRVRLIVPSHGRMGGREIITENITYLRRLRDGRRFDMPGPLTPFYRTTHEANLRACCAPASAGPDRVV